MAVGGEFEAVDADYAVIGVGLAEGAAVVDDVPIVRSGNMQE